ncbi:MAG: ABC transporter ATP-binding protein/permease [Lachnospiraceae bacterium]|nr:ABC transporter ATP-binding protein/permease [Lachnospiraceae bacterium]
MIKTLLAQVKEYKKASLLAPMFAVLEVFMEVLIPLVMAEIIDNGIGKNNTGYAIRMGLLMLGLAMLSLAFGVAAGRFAAQASSGFARNLRKGMFENIQTFAFSNIDRYSTAGLVTRMTTDVTNVQNSYQMILRMCTRAPITLICALAMTIYINASLSRVFLVAIVVLGAALAFIVKTAFPVFNAMFRKYDALNASVQENVTAIRVVKSYVRENHEISKMQKACAELCLMSVKAEKIICYNMPVMQLTVYGCMLSISWFGAHLVVSGSMTTGQLMSMFNYVMNILMSLMMISMIFVMLTMSKASMDRIAEILTEEAEIKNPEHPVKSVADGSIEFDHVNFAYGKNSKNVLEDVSIRIRSGETIGIIGGTGGSKSTFVQMIPRLYDTTGGEVRVGGRNVRDYDLETLRDQVSMVLQKNVLFAGTIKDNLRWGDQNASDEEIEHVCKLAQADEFIQTFPDKYDTWIEQGGTNVSGGQKQRLCIARALLKKPKILILDDSTSAVDTKTDAMIRKAFREEIPETTKLIIAQRISSIQDADRIIVLEEGKIHGVGTHEELLASNSIYRDVYESQMKGGTDDE